MNQIDQDRFWVKVEKSGPDDCWLWIAGKASGYGAFRYNGKTLKANRVAYELTKGPIPKGLFVCHSCDVRACCNPAHLWLGTIADNNADALKKGRVVKLKVYRGSSHGLSKLNDSQRAEIVKLFNQNVSQRELARRFGSSRSTIQRILENARA